MIGVRFTSKLGSKVSKYHLSTLGLSYQEPSTFLAGRNWATVAALQPFLSHDLFQLLIGRSVDGFPSTENIVCTAYELYTRPFLSKPFLLTSNLRQLAGLLCAAIYLSMPSRVYVICYMGTAGSFGDLYNVAYLTRSLRLEGRRLVSFFTQSYGNVLQNKNILLIFGCSLLRV